jgi:hypothetical protein
MTADDHATLREVVDALAPLKRRAGSAEERRAATWLAERLTEAGARARVEEVDFHDGYAALLLPLGLVGVASGVVAAAGRGRWPTVAIPLLAGACVVDDVSNGTRLWRRLTAPRKRTWNVLAQAGDPDAQRTVVIMAHHDAAPTGVVFDQRLQRWIARRFPKLVASTDKSMPLWWPVVGGPSLVALGSLTRRRGVAAAGLVLSVAVSALAADVARSPVVPGANDNLSAVAALVGLAERLRDEPPAGMRVLLVSCGAEEVIQGGVYGFARDHFPRLDPARTWFLNLDTIGSPELLLIEGEGPFRMEDYHDPDFRELIAAAAERVGRPLRRGVRPRVSTDAVLPSRAGYPTATVASWEPETKLPSNYHLMSDTPENLRFETMARAVEVVTAVIGELARDGRD